MAKPMTEPPEWRRRAQRAKPMASPSGWGAGRVADAVTAGLAALAAGDDGAVGAGAVLREITGEFAFLATAERGADVVCEMQAPDGSWGDPGETALIARLLEEMADAVEARIGVDPPPELESEGGGEGG